MIKRKIIFSSSNEASNEEEMTSQSMEMQEQQHVETLGEKKTNCDDTYLWHNSETKDEYTDNDINIEQQLRYKIEEITENSFDGFVGIFGMNYEKAYNLLYQHLREKSYFVLDPIEYDEKKCKDIYKFMALQMYQYVRQCNTIHEYHKDEFGRIVSKMFEGALGVYIEGKLVFCDELLKALINQLKILCAHENRNRLYIPIIFEEGWMPQELLYDLQYIQDAGVVFIMISIFKTEYQVLRLGEDVFSRFFNARNIIPC